MPKQGNDPAITPAMSCAIRHMQKAGASVQQLADFLNEVVALEEAAEDMPALTEAEMAEIDRTGELRLYLTPASSIAITRRGIALSVKGEPPPISILAKNLVANGHLRIADAQDRRRQLFLNASAEDIAENLYGGGLFTPDIWATTRSVLWRFG
jgi:hypothetical protein